MVTQQLKSVRRMAAEILGVGIHRIWIDPERMDEAMEAITREDVKRLIKEGVIKARPIKGTSRVRARIRHEQRRKGRRRGPGTKKGSRIDEKEQWVRRIRAIRRFLRYLRKRRIITPKAYRMLYRMAKGGAFHSIAHVKMYIKEHGLVRR
ncbi:MAG: 50S ribosomal protein L19e [Thermoprotei archaeon]|nr:MAG: 50S ribosomal protein L19e [Thermoprotei archaeon]RLF24453.1 MAG: 50S ribosomal protein L19e [Thermoprotei archaeon]